LQGSSRSANRARRTALGGTLRATRGILPPAIGGRDARFDAIAVPRSNAKNNARPVQLSRSAFHELI